jgi:hypothetical protein
MRRESGSVWRSLLPDEVVDTGQLHAVNRAALFIWMAWTPWLLAGSLVTLLFPAAAAWGVSLFAIVIFSWGLSVAASGVLAMWLWFRLQRLAPAVARSHDLDAPLAFRSYDWLVLWASHSPTARKNPRLAVLAAPLQALMYGQAGVLVALIAVAAVFGSR